MSGFSAQWLALREPADRRARNPAVLADVAAHFADRTTLTIVDLACGTGATQRALAPALPPLQQWLLVDNDLGLLARAADTAPIEGCTVRTAPIDLVRDLELALDGGPDLIVTSALLDLVSREWLDRLVVECAVRQLPLYAALTYDGRMTFTPEDRGDAAIISAFNRHQLRDKGFGPALGPSALPALRSSCKSSGYALREGASDWSIGEDEVDLQQALLTGFGRAALETGNVDEKDVAGWLRRRTDLAMAGRSTLRVGHSDIFAYPMLRA